jgi:hypothetical protein
LDRDRQASLDRSRIILPHADDEVRALDGWRDIEAA